MANWVLISTVYGKNILVDLDKMLFAMKTNDGVDMEFEKEVVKTNADFDTLALYLSAADLTGRNIR